MNNRLFSKSFFPFSAQLEIIKAPERFCLVCTGRRFGKTICGVRKLIHCAYRNAGEYAWIAPTYEITERGVDALRLTVNPIAYQLRHSPTRINLTTRDHLLSRIWFYSADSDDPRSILGHGFSGIVLDEAARISVDAWHTVIRPTLSDKLGWATMFSTPRGRNWFFDEFSRGKDSAESDYTAFHRPSIDNPYFPPAEWDEARRTLPAAIFRQEYEAEFLEDSAGVFTGLDACLVDAPCLHKGAFVMGVDLAKHTDFTVCLGVCAECGRARWLDRFNRLDWPVQVQRILALAREHDAITIVDSTGVGDPIFDDLRAAGLAVEGYRMTATSKTQLIQGLMVAIEQRRITWPRDWDVLTNELRRYEYEYSAAGHLSYDAPSGFHDDCVIALALAVHGLNRFSRPILLDSRGASEELSAVKSEIDQLLAEAETPDERRELEALLHGDNYDRRGTTGSSLALART